MSIFNKNNIEMQLEAAARCQHYRDMLTHVPEYGEYISDGKKYRYQKAWSSPGVMVIIKNEDPDDIRLRCVWKELGTRIELIE